MSRILHYGIYPFFILLFVVPIFLVYEQINLTELQQLSLILILGSVLTAFILEVYLPFDRQYKMFSKQFIWDSYFTFIQLPLISAVIEWIGNYLRVKQVPTLAFLWPHHWNAIIQTFLVLIVAELFYFVYHYFGHKSDLFWKIHKYHHQYDTIYWNNSATFHIVDIFFSAFIYFLPLLLFSVKPQVQYLFVTLSGVTGILIHVNFRHSTKYINKLFNTSELHRWHHQSETMYHNFGKVLCIWDWVFNTRYEKDNDEILKAKYGQPNQK